MAPIMIDYATLCRAIEDWKAGQPPSAVTAAAPQRIASAAHGGDEDAVEYSGVYDTSDAPAESHAPDATVVYQLSEYEESVDDTEGEADDDVEDAVDDDGEVVDDEAAAAVDDDNR